MNALFLSLWVGEGVGLVVGLVLNMVLVMAIYRSVSGHRLQSYSYMFLVAAVFDIIFSIVELATQHQLLIKRGTLFVMPHGFERYVPVWSYPIFMAPHGFVLLHALYILAAMYHYRYRVVTGGSAPISLLLRNVAITSSLAFGLGIGLGVGSVQGINNRGYDYYLQFVDKEWFEESDNSTYFRYACDTEDWGPKLFFRGGSFFATVCTGVVIYYGVRAYQHVKAGGGAGAEASKRTKDLQSQFARTLIAQTVAAFFFAFVPVCIFVFCVAFKVNGRMLGTGVMSPISWLPAANALVTLHMVKDYRRYALGCVGVRTAPGGPSTASNNNKTTRVTDSGTTNQSNAVVHSAELPV